MTLTVVIERDVNAFLRGWVVQGGQRGSMMLGSRQITAIETAQREIERELRCLAPGYALDIEWRLPVEAVRATPMDEETRDQAADAVGRDWRKMAPGGWGMTYTQQGDRVTLEMTRDDFEQLLVLLGRATGGVSDKREFWRAIAFVNELNRTNPGFTPYEIPAEFAGKVPGGGA